MNNSNFPIAIIYIAFLIFIGWLYTVTGSLWSLALLLFLPDTTKDKKENKKDKKESLTKE